MKREEQTLMMTKRAPEPYAPAKSTLSCQPEMSKPWTPDWRALRSLGAALARPREAAATGRRESFMVFKDLLTVVYESVGG